MPIDVAARGDGVVKPRNAGAVDCAASPQPPLGVQAYDARTYVLRQNRCADREANFMYLLVGDDRAMLIDTEAVESLVDMPPAATVGALIEQASCIPAARGDVVLRSSAQGWLDTLVLPLLPA